MPPYAQLGLINVRLSPTLIKIIFARDPALIDHIENNKEFSYLPNDGGIIVYSANREERKRIREAADVR